MPFRADLLFKSFSKKNYIEASLGAWIVYFEGSLNMLVRNDPTTSLLSCFLNFYSSVNVYSMPRLLSVTILIIRTFFCQNPFWLEQPLAHSFYVWRRHSLDYCLSMNHFACKWIVREWGQESQNFIPLKKQIAEK